MTKEQIEREAEQSYQANAQYGIYFKKDFTDGYVVGYTAALSQSPVWVDVNDERKPKPNVYVLVHNYNGYEIAEYRQRDNTFRIGYEMVQDVTHWQPLPSPPTKL